MTRSKFILFIYQWISAFLGKLFPKKNLKEKIEYFYWWITKQKEKELGNKHYQEFFTQQMNLDLEFYSSKKILDIGCGPRGSLEWAIKSEIYGLDPLMSKYKNLGLENHRCTYITGNCEDIPFGDNFFDILSSFNSLDHVDDIDTSIKEIKRVLKPNGIFLLIADIHTHKTICEPSAFDWNIEKKFLPEFSLLEKRELEGNNMYKSIRASVPYNHTNPEKRYGILLAKFCKKPDIQTNLNLV